MKHIYQKYKTDCAVAAFAMVMNINYQCAMRILHPNRRWRGNATTTVGQIAGVLDRWGIPYQLTDNAHFDLLPYNSIVIVKTAIKTENHAVVWDAKNRCIRDPNRKNHNTPLPNYIHSFICAIILK